jgi:hypothetical protein
LVRGKVVREGDHLKDPGVDGRMIYKSNFLRSCKGGMDWIDLAVDRDRWRAVNKCRNEPSGSKKCGEILEWLRTC